MENVISEIYGTPDKDYLNGYVKNYIKTAPKNRKLFRIYVRFVSPLQITPGIRNLIKMVNNNFNIIDGVEIKYQYQSLSDHIRLIYEAIDPIHYDYFHNYNHNMTILLKNVDKQLIQIIK